MYKNIDLKELKVQVDRKANTIFEMYKARFKILRVILQYVDRTSMTNSIETRVPFLDKEYIVTATEA